MSFDPARHPLPPPDGPTAECVAPYRDDAIDASGKTIWVGDKVLVIAGTYVNRKAVVLGVEFVGGEKLLAVRMPLHGIRIIPASRVQYWPRP